MSAMIVQPREFAQKTAILIGIVAACGIVGFCVPLLFDRDVGAALAAELLGIAGLIFGFFVGAFVIRRNFD
jgi:nitrate/nitrite transporter NarK